MDQSGYDFKGNGQRGKLATEQIDITEMHCGRFYIQPLEAEITSYNRDASETQTVVRESRRARVLT